MPLAAPAVAQVPSPADSARADTALIRLAPIEVLGSILPTVAGPRPESRVPARVLVHAGTELRRWQPRQLGDVLVRRAAASRYDDLGSPFKQTLVLRGFAASPVVGLPQGVSVLVDGVPMNEPGAGEVNFDLLPLEAVERIEVLSGTASLLGPNSLGGAVNLVTRRDGESGGAFTLRAGSHGARGGHARAAGRSAGWQWHTGAGHERERGFRADMGGERTHGFLSVQRLEERRGARLLLFGGRTRAETAGSLPLSVYRVRPDSNLTAGDFELLRQLHAAVSGYADVGAGSASIRMYGRIGDAERFNVNQAADPDVRGFTSSRSAGLDADWTVAQQLGGALLELRLGAGGLLNRTTIELYAERVDPGITTAVSSAIARVDGYALAALDAGPVTLSAGARWDAVRVPFRNRLRPDRDTVSTFRQLSPRAGVGVRVARGVTVYGSLGRSFRPPALIEIACADPEEPCPLPFALGDDPPIEPVRVTTREVGAGWTFRALEAQLSAYRSEVYDDIFLFPYDDEDEPDGSTIDGYFDNVPHTRREGLEASASVALPGEHALFASYLWSRATFRTGEIEIFSIREAGGAENDVSAGDRFPLVPAHTLSLGADLALPRGLQAGGVLRHVGVRYLRGDEANDEAPLAGHTLLDARAGFAGGGWELQLLVRNLTDVRYAAFGTFNINQGAGDVLERFLTPGAPRSFSLSLTRSF